MYINVKKSNVNNYTMARVSLDVKVGTQEGIWYISLSQANNRKGLEAREVLGGFVPLSVPSLVFALASPLACLLLNLGKYIPRASGG